MKNILQVLALPLAFVILTLLAYLLQIHGEEYPAFRGGTSVFATDWRTAFQPAALNLLSGESPYHVPGFFNPPWILIPLIPFALFPTIWGASMLYAINLICYLWVAKKMNMHPIFIALMVAYMVLNSLFGNIEGLVILGIVFPAPIALFFLMSKPQLGITVALFYGVEAWRRGGFPEVVKVFLPVSIAFLVSFALYGLYPLRVGALCWWCNASIFPYGIPVGVLLVVLSIFMRNIGYALAAGPFLSPYLAWNTWCLVAFVFSRKRELTDIEE